MIYTFDENNYKLPLVGYTRIPTDELPIITTNDYFNGSDLKLIKQKSINKNYYIQPSEHFNYNNNDLYYDYVEQVNYKDFTNKTTLTQTMNNLLYRSTYDNTTQSFTDFVNPVQTNSKYFSEYHQNKTSQKSIKIEDEYYTYNSYWSRLKVNNTESFLFDGEISKDDINNLSQDSIDETYITSLNPYKNVNTSTVTFSNVEPMFALRSNITPSIDVVYFYDRRPAIISNNNGSHKIKMDMNWLVDIANLDLMPLNNFLLNNENYPIFKDYDWEHPTQSIKTFKSLFYINFYLKVRIGTFSDVLSNKNAFLNYVHDGYMYFYFKIPTRMIKINENGSYIGDNPSIPPFHTKKQGTYKIIPATLNGSIIFDSTNIDPTNLIHKIEYSTNYIKAISKPWLSIDKNVLDEFVNPGSYGKDYKYIDGLDRYMTENLDKINNKNVFYYTLNSSNLSIKFGTTSDDFGTDTIRNINFGNKLTDTRHWKFTDITMLNYKNKPETVYSFRVY